MVRVENSTDFLLQLFVDDDLVDEAGVSASFLSGQGHEFDLASSGACNYAGEPEWVSPIDQADFGLGAEICKVHNTTPGQAISLSFSRGGPPSVEMPSGAETDAFSGLKPIGEWRMQWNSWV